MPTPAVPFETTRHVREHCLCLAAQSAARTLARLFDEALRPVGITSGQFSLLMSLNSPEPPTLGAISSVLAMDRTTLTANLKPLERRGLVTSIVDADDRRVRRLGLSKSGRAALRAALPIWKKSHAQLDARLDQAAGAEALRAGLRALA
jgi:DNA-binding MarR family transcriptional regulator